MNPTKSHYGITVEPPQWSRHGATAEFPLSGRTTNVEPLQSQCGAAAVPPQIAVKPPLSHYGVAVEPSLSRREAIKKLPLNQYGAT